MIVVVSAGATTRATARRARCSSRCSASRSIVHVVEMRAIGASGRLGNVRGRRNFTTDRAAEAALGLQELLQGLVDRTRGDLRSHFLGERLPRVARGAAAALPGELIVEYAHAGSTGPLQIGTRCRTAHGAGGGARSGSPTNHEPWTAPGRRRRRPHRDLVLAAASGRMRSARCRPGSDAELPPAATSSSSPSTRCGPIASARSAARAA